VSFEEGDIAFLPKGLWPMQNIYYLLKQLLRLVVLGPFKHFRLQNEPI
jgi:hypothetical protein